MHSLPHRRPSSGFTLLELLVVLTIAGLLVALAPPLYSKAVPGTMLKTTTLTLAISLREARSHAISSSNRTDITLFTDPPSYTIGNTAAISLPDGISITAYDYFTALPGSSTATHSLTKENLVIHFFPDGSSNGAALAVTNGTTAYNIAVSWLTGAVTISEARDDGH